MKNAKKVQNVDLGAIFDAHVRHEFVDHDVAATMKTMAAEPYVHNVPTLTGGDGHSGVVDFYTHHFVGKMPADTRVERISRTVGRDQVVDDSSCISRTTARSTSCFPVLLRPGGKSRCRMLS